MKFDYAKLPLRSKSPLSGLRYVLRPIIPIKLTIQPRRVGYAALLDSGADFCIFHADVGEALGLNVRSGERQYFSGVQAVGKAEAFIHPVRLTVGELEYRAEVLFSYDINKAGFGVFGHIGFFDHFTITFDLAKEQIELVERE